MVRPVRLASDPSDHIDKMNFKYHSTAAMRKKMPAGSDTLEDVPELRRGGDEQQALAEDGFTWRLQYPQDGARLREVPSRRAEAGRTRGVHGVGQLGKIYAEHVVKVLLRTFPPLAMRAMDLLGMQKPCARVTPGND